MGRRRRHGAFARLADFLVYALVRALVALVQILSLRHAYWVADGLAWVMFRVDRRHRMVGVENLRWARGWEESDEAARVALVREVYRHFCWVLMEMMLLGRSMRLNTWRRMIVPVNHGPLVDLLLQRRPVIVVSGHYGNWEMASLLLGVFGFRGQAVARILDNPYLEAYLKRFRKRTGQGLIPKKGGYDQMVHCLNHNGMLLMLGDQDAGQNGLYVDFLGRPASSHKAIALLALEHNAPIVVSYARRVTTSAGVGASAGVVYEVGVETILEPSEFAQRARLTGGDEVKAITQAYAHSLERIVMAGPSQYFWLHRRWKHQPKPRARRHAAKVVVHDPSLSTPAGPKAELSRPELQRFAALPQASASADL